MESCEEIFKPEAGSDLALKPCPFCGNKEVFYMRYECPAGQRWKVVCGECVATIDPGYAQQRERVMTMWNRRSTEGR